MGEYVTPCSLTITNLDLAQVDRLHKSGLCGQQTRVQHSPGRWNDLTATSVLRNKIMYPFRKKKRNDLHIMFLNLVAVASNILRIIWLD